MKADYQKRCSKEGGASLLELLIVLGIVGVAVAIAAGRIGPTLELQRLDTASSMVASKLAEARMTAIKRNQLGKLHIDAGLTTMQVTSPDTAVGPVETLPRNIIFTTSTPGTIIFDSLGRLNTPAKTVILQSQSGRTKTVLISAVGEITIGPMS